MTGIDTRSESTPLAPTSDAEVIEQLRQAIAGGQHWYLALLEAIGKWGAVEETGNGRTYHYLINGEAFDLLLLAERLCQAVDDLLPEAERDALLLHSQPPLDLPTGEFKKLIGSTKYRQYLNYFYGVTVEEALILAVQGEIHKERQASGYFKNKDVTNETYQRIYAATRAVLLRRFRKEKDHPLSKSTSLTELKEFTYWLFKYRLKHCDKARVASDTKKALNWLDSNRKYRHLDGNGGR